MSFLKHFIEATAWTMEKPKAYGAFHLIFTFVGLAVCILLAYVLRKTGKRGNRIVLTSVGVFLLLTEIYKQLFYYYHIGEGSYQWWIFPFQLCSVPMYLCLIAPWLKEGKVQAAMYHFMTTFNLLGGIMAFAEPSGIIHGYWTLTLHAFVWHMILIFVGLYLIASGRGAKTVKDYLSSVVLFLVLAVIAFVINLLFWDVSGGSIKMFYVGPAISPLAVFKDIATNCGWYVNTPIYLVAVSLGAFLLFLPAYLYERRKQKKAALTTVS
ncbi:MAG: YwaF family protein [Clostridia bacterium]|nr:YwaF family protein [Clostridia bacterium]